MEPSFADIHCHPAGWNFQRLRQTPAERDPAQYHPWNVTTDVDLAAKGGRSFRYSQCDFARLLASNTRLVWASLYPFEKGFFDETLIGRKQRKANERTLLDWIQQGAMRLSGERIEYLQSDRYDYFQELLLEYEFYQLGNGVTVRSAPAFRDGDKVRTIPQEGSYRLIDQATGFTQPNSQKKEVSVVLSVEGMHALGLGNPPNKGQDVDMDTVLQRIRQLKGEGKNGWAHPIFSITFSHHFDNTLLGHAKSMPSISKLIFGQEKNLDSGLIRSEAHQAVLAWLGLDLDLRDTGSKRVLLDVKHLSAASRRYLYESVIRPYNQLNPSRKIPVLASHVGYSGMGTLREQIQFAPKERSNSLRDGFLAWNINLCAEDVAVVVESEGLIGLSLDQRILGVNRYLLGLVNLPKRNNIRAISRTLEYMVAAGMAYGHSPEACWRSFAIGSDFGGYIDPINDYSTALAFPQFRSDLLESLSDLRKKRPELFGTLRPEQVVESVCYRNAVEFTHKHFPTRRAVLESEVIA